MLNCCSETRSTPATAICAADSAATIGPAWARVLTSMAMLAVGLRGTNVLDDPHDALGLPHQVPRQQAVQMNGAGYWAGARSRAGHIGDALVRGSSTCGKERVNTRLFHWTTSRALRKLRYRVSGSSGTVPIPVVRALRNIPTSASRKP